MYSNNVLFKGRSVDDFLAAQSNQIVDKVSQLSREQLDSSRADIIKNLKEEFYIQPLSLNEDSITKTRQDVKIAGRRDPFFDERSSMVDGAKITFTIPYEGYRPLWDYKPSTFLLVASHAEVGANHLTTTTNVTVESENPAAEVENFLKGWLQDVRANAQNVNNQVIPFNNRLEAIIVEAIDKQQERFAKQNSLADKLGF